MNINKLVDYLRLEKPFQIQLKSRKNKNQDAAYWAIYQDGGDGELSSHLIRIYLGNNADRSVNSLIAHELIHAWQEENLIKEIHGQEFRTMSAQVSRRFSLKNVYIPERDI